MSQAELITTLGNAWSAAGFPGEVRDLERLTGGANKETWRFSSVISTGSRELILRRNTGSQQAMNDIVGTEQASLLIEAQLIQALQNRGLKIPQVVALFNADSPLGEAFVMTCEPGESLPNKILNSGDFAQARGQLTADCAAQLATLHAIELPDEVIRNLPSTDLAARINRMEALSEQLGNDSPIHAVAYHWLRGNMPNQSKRCLVHADFRLGNLLVDQKGLTSILDWELARISYPEEDLGYLSANIWRFGKPQNPVGGFGQYEALLDSYEQQAGWRPSMQSLLYWQFFTAVSWGTICLSMHHLYTSGADRSLERLAVGRRFSESEVDILLLLEQLA